VRCGEVSGLLRAVSLKALRSHSDLLLFQIGNWLSGQILFAVFGVFAVHGALAHIAFVETASAFFGTTFATIAFRIGFESAMKARMLVAARFAVLFAMALAAGVGAIEWKWVIGVAPSLLTPAHFPVVFGARKGAVALLVGARLLACAACVGFALSSSMAFAVYFAPGLAYALALYLFHFSDWARQSSGGRQPRSMVMTGSPLDIFLLLPMISAGLFFMQASIVSNIATASPALAVVERLVRSGYSLVYPYLMRIARFDHVLRRTVGMLAFALPVAASVISLAPLAVIGIWIPVSIDLVTTNLFRLGRRRLRMLAGWVTLCLALWLGAAWLR
jgi:hypothetical protein